MDKVSMTTFSVSKPTLADNEREQLDQPSRLVKGSGVDILQSKQALALTLDYVLFQGDGPRDPATFVLSLPAAGQIVRQLQEAVDECLQRVTKEDQR